MSYQEVNSLWYYRKEEKISNIIYCEDQSKCDSDF